MSEKLQQLIKLIAGLDPKDPALFTKSNLPDSRVLTEKLGEAVSAAERDEAFAAFKEQHPKEYAAMAAVLDPPAEEAETPAEKKSQTEKTGGMVTGQDALKHLRKKGVTV